MIGQRVVVGAEGDGECLPMIARRLRDAGHEVVLAGGHQTPAQLARTAVAEDAARVVVDADDDTVARVAAACAALDASDIVVDRGCDAVDATSPRVKG